MSKNTLGDKLSCTYSPSPCRTCRTCNKRRVIVVIVGPSTQPDKEIMMDRSYCEMNGYPFDKDTVRRGYKWIESEEAIMLDSWRVAPEGSCDEYEPG